MKIKILLFILLIVLNRLYSEILVIHRTDGSSIPFAVNNIIDLTFEAEESEAIQIYKTDETTDIIEISQIENIEFTEIEPVNMLINKTDGTIYEIETDLIVYITFGEITSLEDASELISSIPIRFLKNTPNPFNPNTSIRFELYESGFTKIEIYNINGQMIKTLLESTLSIGSHNIEWNGIDKAGKTTSSGVYFYKISVNGTQKINKMLLLK